MLVILHIAVNGHYDPVSPSFKNNGGTAVGGDAPDSNLGLVAMNNSVELFLSAMILDEVFERHDGLQVLSLEHGVMGTGGSTSSISSSAPPVAAPRSPGVGRGGAHPVCTIRR